MMLPANANSDDTRRLLEQVRAGHAPAIAQLLARHRRYMRLLVEWRLDPRLRRRVDPSDVVQETQLEAARRLPTYAAEPPMSLRIWLRRITYDRLIMLHRQHADARCRDIGRETTLPDASAVELGQRALSTGDSPSQCLIRGELGSRVRLALAALSEGDREILIMRAFEGLSNLEVAEALDIDAAAASKRYGRALLRLRARLLEAGLKESEL